ncbi:MAG TPA: adenylate/guanylate cyclase domain-containing protein [Gaiellales bacterium]|nr:adenylate/guanylate cyclase domain-containing protein [Gaiellales bacterium]
MMSTLTPHDHGGDDAIAAELRRVVESACLDRHEGERVLATVLFTDIVGSTERAVALGDRRWARLLAGHNAMVRAQLARFGGREVDTAGDGFFASFDTPGAAVGCAQAIVEAVRLLGLEIRTALHAGECQLVDGKIAGIAVHTGARLVRHAGAGEVLVSGTVRDLVAGSGLRFDCRGSARLRGLPDDVRLFALAA